MQYVRLSPDFGLVTATPKRPQNLCFQFFRSIRLTQSGEKLRQVRRMSSQSLPNQWDQEYFKMSKGLSIANLLFTCLPLVLNVYSTIILFKCQIRKAFAFFGTQLVLLTIAEIILCLSSQILIACQFFTPLADSSLFLVVSLASAVLWISYSFSNWTVALLCVREVILSVDILRSNLRGSIFGRLSYFVLIVITGALSLTVVLCQNFGVIKVLPMFFSLLISTNMLPMLVILIATNLLFYKRHINTSPRNKITILLAIIYFISMLVVAILGLISTLMRFPTLGLYHFVAYLCESTVFLLRSLALIFVFCLGSTLFRTEALARLKCPRKLDDPIHEFQLNDV